MSRPNLAARATLHLVLPGLPLVPRYRCRSTSRPTPSARRDSGTRAARAPSWAALCARSARRTASGDPVPANDRSTPAGRAGIDRSSTASARPSSPPRRRPAPPCERPARRPRPSRGGSTRAREVVPRLEHADELGDDVLHAASPASHSRRTTGRSSSRGGSTTRLSSRNAARARCSRHRDAGSPSGRDRSCRRGPAARTAARRRRAPSGSP